MINRLKPKSEFSRNVLTLMTGTTIAQAIPIAISPILTRLYSPSDFGILALFMSLVMLFGSIAGFKYELAINLQDKDDDALEVLFLSGLITLLLSIFLFTIVFVFNKEIVNLLGNNDIAFWLYLVPLSVLFLGFYNSLNYWYNRKKNFNHIAKARVIQSASVGFGQLILSTISSKLGLVSGFIFGQMISFLFFLISFLKSGVFQFSAIKSESVFKKLKKYRKFAIYQTPSTGIEVLSSQLPVFLLTPFFGSSIVGLYSVSQRVVRTPIQVISSSISDVFRQKASEEFVKTGDVRHIFKAVLFKLFLISIIPFSIFYIYSPELFSFVFGKEWYIAGVYAQIMTPMFWLSFIVGPVSVMFIIAEKQEYDLVMQLFLLLFTFIALYTGYKFFNSVEMSLILLTVIYSLKYLIELFLSYKFSKVN